MAGGFSSRAFQLNIRYSKKLSEIMPSYNFMSKKNSIAAKVSNAKKILMEPNLFNQEDIAEMVNECVRILTDTKTKNPA